MCRFLVYKGREMFMSDLITKSEQSLIRQSFSARERHEPLNGDGFGIGWYMPEIDSSPCVFRDVRPAWANENLRRLAEKIRSGAMFAHVRAASRDTAVSEANCHPFQVGEFLWMHNGKIASFDRIKRKLREGLSDQYYGCVQGTTDSEHAFALFMDILSPHSRSYSAQSLVDAMQETVAQLKKLTDEEGAESPSYFNFSLTDGRHTIVTRHVTRADADAPSLYYTSGAAFEAVDGRYHMQPAIDGPESYIIASEPLTSDRDEWASVPANHMVVLDPELKFQLFPIP